MLKVKEAEATLARSTAAFFPSFNLAASEDIAKVQSLKHTEAYSFTGNASWTIDIFGGIQNARKGAKAALMQSVAYKRAVETQVFSGVAIAYYTLLALDRQLEISLVNERIGKKFTVTYSNDTLPSFVEWKSMASGDYALGLEPATTELDDRFTYKIIKPNEKIRFNVNISVTRI
jgi:hypothetical protein